MWVVLAAQAQYDMAHSQAMGHEALRQFADHHLDHLRPYFPSVAGKPAVIPESTTYEDFVVELKRALDKQQLAKRAFDWIFDGHLILSKPHPNCGGERAVQCAAETFTLNVDALRYVWQRQISPSLSF